MRKPSSAILSAAAILCHAMAPATASPQMHDLLTAEVALFRDGPIRSWTQKRAQAALKSQLDQSCSAASLAAILNVFCDEECGREPIR